jgi:hypothetical protein
VTTGRERPGRKQLRLGLLAPAPVLHDAAAGTAARDAGLARVEAGAAGEFSDTALLVVERLAREQPQVTSEEVWPRLEGVLTTDNRALGPVMRRAQRLGYIAPTDRVTLTTMPRSHRSPMRIWKSLIYRGAA